MAWRSGILALLGALAAAPSYGMEPITSYQCQGNEPFWSLDTNQTSAVLSRPGTNGTDKTLYKGHFHDRSYFQPPVSVWRGKKDEDTLVAVIRQEACSDTMKDGPAFSHSVIMSAPWLEAVSGCCRQTRVMVHQNDAVPRAGGADWSKRIRSYLPAIRICTLDSGIEVERVDLAWPMNRGLVGVRLRAQDGSRHDCLAEQGGGAIVGVEKLSDADGHMKGEANPVFYPASEQPPLVEVGKLDQLVDADGVFQGWLHYPPRPLAPVAPIIGEWLLEDIGGQGVIDNLNTPFILTADGKVNGHAGCNRFFGTADIQGSLIAIGPTMSTKMACPGAIMDQERRFFSALGKIESWALENGLLKLKDGGGETLLRFAPAD